MSDAGTSVKTRNNWLIYIPLAALTLVCVVAGALAMYAIFTEWGGYSGGKSGILYIGGAFGGYMLTQPLWMLYCKYYPKAEEPDAEAARSPSDS